MSPYDVPRAAYVHVPFCRHRCGYCNFTLIAGRSDLIADYLRAIGQELRRWGPPTPVDTLFFGGGTPTFLPPARFAELSQLVLEQFPLRAGYEWSVEANPSDLTAEYIACLAGLGVNRLSLGVQSFDAGKLQLLERDHRRDQVAQALAEARGAIASLSCDLIFAAPGETLDLWRRDLAELITLRPDHVSTYGLTYERGARFWSRRERGEFAAAAEDLERAMYEAGIAALQAAGYEHYEVSNFARPGHRCRHNDVYWSGEPYFAVGPGAASYVQGTRRMNHASTTRWLQRALAGESAVAEQETLEPMARARERLVFALRRMEGIDCEEFAAATGFSVDQLAGSTIQQYLELGMLAADGSRLHLTHAGLLISDALWPRLLAG